tara:strand:+ start:782 stop:1150 length:369 start_codon:yes stop_codon:yes gene_type:complete
MEIILQIFPESSCLDISRLVNGIGLFLNIIGISILFKLDYVKFLIESMREVDFSIDPADPTHLMFKDIENAKNKSYRANKKAEQQEHQQNKKKNLKKLKVAIFLILGGLILQIFSLFLIGCF